MKSTMSRLTFALGAAMAAATFFAVGTVVAAGQSAGAPPPQTHKGLEMSVTGIARGRIVSLRDCPPGANTQRGVIRPIEDTEFVTVSLAITVQPSFAPVEIDKPVLFDEGGQEFHTAQSFTDAGSPASYTCDFSFRVPKGTKVTRFAVEDASFDVTALDK